MAAAALQGTEHRIVEQSIHREALSSSRSIYIVDGTLYDSPCLAFLIKIPGVSLETFIGDTMAARTSIG